MLRIQEVQVENVFFVVNLLYLCHPWILPGEILGSAVALTCCMAAPPISYLLQPDS